MPISPALGVMTGGGARFRFLSSMQMRVERFFRWIAHFDITYIYVCMSSSRMCRSCSMTCVSADYVPDNECCTRQNRHRRARGPHKRTRAARRTRTSLHCHICDVLNVCSGIFRFASRSPRFCLSCVRSMRRAWRTCGRRRASAVAPGKGYYFGTADTSGFHTAIFAPCRYVQRWFCAASPP